MRPRVGRRDFTSSRLGHTIPCCPHTFHREDFQMTGMTSWDFKTQAPHTSQESTDFLRSSLNRAYFQVQIRRVNST